MQDAQWGQNTYSLAMVLRENMGMILRNVRIRTTDIDNSNLFEDIIKDGIYPREMVRNTKPIFDKYFTPADERITTRSPRNKKKCGIHKA
ncbi:MAG: CheR family methyltransferase [Methanolobus sp.]